MPYLVVTVSTFDLTFARFDKNKTHASIFDALVAACDLTSDGFDENKVRASIFDVLVAAFDLTKSIFDWENLYKTTINKKNLRCRIVVYVGTYV